MSGTMFFTPAIQAVQNILKKLLPTTLFLFLALPFWQASAKSYELYWSYNYIASFFQYYTLYTIKDRVYVNIDFHANGAASQGNYNVRFTTPTGSVTDHSVYVDSNGNVSVDGSSRYYLGWTIPAGDSSNGTWNATVTDSQGNQIKSFNYQINSIFTWSYAFRPATDNIQMHERWDYRTNRSSENVYLFTNYRQNKRYVHLTSSPECKVAMAMYSFDSMTGALHVSDTPIQYSSPKGPQVKLTTMYSQDIVGDHDVTKAFSNFGKNWNLTALSYIRHTNNTEHKADSGMKPLEGYISTQTTTQGTPDPGFGKFLPDPQTNAVMHYDSSVPCYRKVYPDGSEETFAKVIRPPVPIQGWEEFYMLTEYKDPQGNKLTFNYAADATLHDSTSGADYPVAKLLNITDSLGQQTVFSYESSDPLRVTRITDPFGRFATFAYDGNGRLQSITDPAGIVSSFVYDANGLMQSMTTPYGTTSFSIQEGEAYRIVEATEPTGDKQRIEYRGYIDPSIIPASDPNPPSAYTLVINNNDLNKFNTFFWDRKAMIEVQKAGDVPGTASHYAKAKLTHWMHDNDGANAFVSSEKLPLEGRVWYNYKAADGTMMTDTLTDTSAIMKPCHIARVLDDGYSQFNRVFYNSLGNPYYIEDDWGRSQNFDYAANKTDVLRIRQTSNAVVNDIIAEYTYNDQHLPLTYKDAAGQITTYTYNTAGQPLTITNPKSQTTSYTYDANGYLTLVDGPIAGSADSTQFTYQKGMVRTITDSEGYTVTTDYDNLDRPTRRTYPDGTFEQITYNRLDPITHTDRLGRSTQYEYNALRELTKTTDPLGRQTLMEYCRCGGMKKLTDPAGNITKWDYDVQGRLLSKTFADNTQITYQYQNRTSRLASITDALSQKKVFRYCETGHLSNIFFVNAQQTAMPYLTFYYDKYWRVTSILDNIQGNTTYTYKAAGSLGAGKLASADGPLANDLITYDYDELGRRVGRSINGTASSWQYDVLGRVTNETNPLGSFNYSYEDFTNRIASMSSPNGMSANYTYYDNEGDQLLGEINHLNAQSVSLSKHTYEYNSDKQITRWRQELGSAYGSTRDYDMGYDAANQLSSDILRVAVPNVTTQQLFTYDLAGNRTKATRSPILDAKGTFNSLNQMTSFNSVVKYNAPTPPNPDTYPQQPSGVTPLNTTPIFDGVQVTARDASGNPTQYTAWFGYKNPNAYSVSIPAGTTTSSTNYLQRTLSGGATQFETTQPVKFAPGTWHFLWNVTFTPQESVKWGLNSNVITASAASLVTTEGPSGAVGYVSTARPHAYDLNGNTLNDGLRAYTWDAENRPIKIVQEGTTYEFNYDGLGRRLKEKVNGVLKKQWIWDGDELVEERDGSNNTTRKFFSQGAQISGANYYYTRDHLGSVIGIYDSTGNVKARYAYDAYGMRTIPLPGAPASNFAFTGHYIHSTNLLLTRHRLYDPETAHWLSRDPLGEDGGINLYGYVGNNPVNAIDPDGRDVIYLNDVNGARGFGHSSVIVGNDKSGWMYFSRDGNVNDSPVNTTLPFQTFEEFQMGPYASRYNRWYHINTSPKQDINMTKLGKLLNQGNYYLKGRNCGDLAEQILEAGQIQIPEAEDTRINNYTVPNRQWDHLIKTGLGQATTFGN